MRPRAHFDHRAALRQPSHSGQLRERAAISELSLSERHAPARISPTLAAALMAAARALSPSHFAPLVARPRCRRARFYDRTVLIPRNAESILNGLYGHGWRVMVSRVNHSIVRSAQRSHLLYAFTLQQLPNARPLALGDVPPRQLCAWRGDSRQTQQRQGQTGNN